MDGPQTAVQEANLLPEPLEDDERVVGSAVMGLPFASGHYLAFRNWTKTSFADPYKAVFHRTPGGRWTIYSTAEPQNGCGRFWSAAVNSIDVVEIDTGWTDPANLVVRIPEVEFEWAMTIDRSVTTSFMSSMAGAMPERAWTNDTLLRAMGAMAGPFLRIGKTNMVGNLPNGQHFRMAPKQMWRINNSTAFLGGEDFGEVGPSGGQLHLGNVWLPRQGIFALGSVRADAYDPAIHHSPLATIG